MFSALLVQQRISMILCLIVRHIAPTLSSFFTLHDPKVMARFSRECFEHTNTLMAAQTGHNLEFSVQQRCRTVGILFDISKLLVQWSWLAPRHHMNEMNEVCVNASVTMAPLTVWTT